MSPLSPVMPSPLKGSSAPTGNRNQVFSKGQKDRRLNSPMFFSYYHKFINSEREIRVQCNYCTKDYAFGYRTRQKHTINKHANEWTTHYEGEINTTGNHVSSTSSFKYDNYVPRRELAKFIYVKCLPFSFSDCEKHEKFVTLSLCADARFVPCTSLTRQVKKFFRCSKSYL